MITIELHTKFSGYTRNCDTPLFLSLINDEDEVHTEQLPELDLKYLIYHVVTLRLSNHVTDYLLKLNKFNTSEFEVTRNQLYDLKDRLLTLRNENYIAPIMVDNFKEKLNLQVYTILATALRQTSDEEVTGSKHKFIVKLK